MLSFSTFVPTFTFALRFSLSHLVLLFYFAFSAIIGSLDHTIVLQLVIVRQLYSRNECIPARIPPSAEKYAEQESVHITWRVEKKCGGACTSMRGVLHPACVRYYARI